jgi:hypothetical protein
MAQIDITARILGEDALRETLQRMSSHEIPRAIRAGVRYAAGSGKTTIAQSIRASYSITSARVKKDVTAPQFRNGGQTAVIRTSRKPITAMQFKARETRRGLSMAIYKGERTIVSRGFIAKGMPFRRVGKARMPITVVHGPSVHAIYTGGRHAGQIKQATEQRIEERLVTGIMRHLGRVGRGFG